MQVRTRKQGLPGRKVGSIKMSPNGGVTLLVQDLALVFQPGESISFTKNGLVLDNGGYQQWLPLVPIDQIQDPKLDEVETFLVKAYSPSGTGLREQEMRLTRRQAAIAALNDTRIRYPQEVPPNQLGYRCLSAREIVEELG